MTLFSRLFAKKLNSNSAVVKKPAANTLAQRIAQLHQLSADDLAAIATSDQEQALRIAATEKLPFGDTLKSLACDQNTSKLQVAARERIAALIDNQSLNIEQLSAAVDDKLLLLAISGFCNNTQLQERILNGADDEAFLCKVALEGTTVQLRTAAATRLSHREHLAALLKKTKGKDKSVYRIAKQKCDAFKEQDKQQQQIAASVDALCIAAERLSRRAFDPVFSASFHHLQQQWSDLQQQQSAVITDTAQQRMEQALAACRIIDEQQAKEQAEHQQKQQARASAAQTRENILQQLRQVIATLYADEPSGTANESIANDPTANEAANNNPATGQRLSEQKQAWQQTIGHMPASVQQQKLFDHLCEAVTTLEQHLQQYGTLTQQLELLADADSCVGQQQITDLRQRVKMAQWLTPQPLPDSVIQAQQWLQNWDQQQQTKRNSKQQLIRQAGALIRRANEAVQQGHVRQAAGIERSIEQKLAELESIPGNLSGQFERFKDRLKKLQDWQSYAVEPKMHELVAQMQQLLDTTLAPDMLAQKIKQLQEQWKQLSKGTGDQYQTLWDQFHQLAQRAYEPCKLYFQEQADLRQQNLQKRQALVTELEHFFSTYNWDEADWKLVEKMLRVARQQWRDYSPTDRAATKAVQQAFDARLNAIEQHLNVEYKKNTVRKQQLIDLAKQWVDHDDIRTSVEEIKKLQAMWKGTGVLPRNVDQSLWQQFRTHCDTVFAKRQQHSEQFKHQLNATKEQALALCREVEQLSTLNGQALLNARSELERLQQAFHELGTLPKGSAGAIKSTFFTAVKQFEANVNQAQKQAKAQRWQNLADAGAALAAFERAVFNGAAMEPARQEAQRIIDAIDTWPKEGKDVIEKKLASVTGDCTTDIVANEAALRHLCIRAEILADLPTPVSDQSARMAYQVERLQQGLGQVSMAGEQDAADLLYEWIQVGPVPAECYQQLLTRFNQCREKLL